MKLAVSNIAWASENDRAMYAHLQEHGISGLEIAPTRFFKDNPYARPDDARTLAEQLTETYKLAVCSMQSIWYGRKENIFASLNDRQELSNYTKKAIDFAVAVGAKNLVFGCPKNRNGYTSEQHDLAVDFFKQLGDYAAKHQVVIALEANPQIYGTDFLNTTKETVEFIREVNSQGVRLNLDLGTIISNEEQPEELTEIIALTNHVHLSEPYLKPIKRRELHRTIINSLKVANYNNYISLEMAKPEDFHALIESIDYLIELGRS